MPVTVTELQAALDRLDDGVLKQGAHKPGREFCALEFKSQVDSRKWTDDPKENGMPDIRPLNDLFPHGADQERTEALLPVMVALWDWDTWSTTRQTQFVQTIAIETVRQIISSLPNLPRAIQEQCLVVGSIGAAQAAAQAAARAAAQDAARAAARAAQSAAWAAAWAAAGALRRIGKLACNIWVEAAH